jgi:4-carboxymuconolactone decarboxylase
MTRIKVLKRDEMSPEQGKLWDDIKTEGGPLGGPHYAYIRYPRLMRAVQDVGFALNKTDLTQRERQIAILAVCRFWGAEYPWAVQVRNGVKIGLDQAMIDSVNAGQRPALADAREQMAYDLAMELLTARKLSKATYDKAAKLFGETELICLVSTVGQYSMTCLTTSAFDVTPPDDVPHRLKHEI